MPGSLTSGFLWSRGQVRRSRHSRRMRNPQFYVSCKRPMACCLSPVQVVSSSWSKSLWLLMLLGLHMYWCSTRNVTKFECYICISLCVEDTLFFTSTHKLHDDVIKWKHFPRYWPFVRGSHRSTVNSPHKGQWRGALMFSLICVWINGWVNNRDSGDLRRHRAHHDVIVMTWYSTSQGLCTPFALSS